MRAKNVSTGEVKIDRRLVDEARSATKAKSSGTASSWATLVKRVFEVDPLQCPQCGSRMKVVSFIDRCQRELWKRSSVIVVCGRARCERWPRPGLHPTQRTRIETHELQLVLDPQSSFSEHLSRPQTGVRTDQVVATPELPK